MHTFRRTYALLTSKGNATKLITVSFTNNCLSKEEHTASSSKLNQKARSLLANIHHPPPPAPFRQTDNELMMAMFVDHRHTHTYYGQTHLVSMQTSKARLLPLARLNMSVLNAEKRRKDDDDDDDDGDDDDDIIHRKHAAGNTSLIALSQRSDSQSGRPLRYTAKDHSANWHEYIMRSSALLCAVRFKASDRADTHTHTHPEASGTSFVLEEQILGQRRFMHPLKGCNASRVCLSLPVEISISPRVRDGLDIAKLHGHGPACQRRM